MPPAPASIDVAEGRIGRVVWRVRAELARFAAGRSRPQQETFRRPTAILVDPVPTSAALVVTNFVPKFFAQRSPVQSGSRCRGVGLVLNPVQPVGSDVASS